MKLQFGISYRDRRPASTADLVNCLDDYSSWNAETTGEVIDGSVLMAYRGDRITCEEDNEIQPYRLGQRVLTFDGRLDNRSDIALKGGLQANSSLPDPVLIAKARELCGDAIFRDLLGEFSITLWCSDTRNLTFIRSIDGSRPLYYVANADRIMWSSDIGHLLRFSHIDIAIDDDYILQYLLLDPVSGKTPFVAIKAVPAGYVVSFRPDNPPQYQQLWSPSDIPMLPSRSDAEYEEMLRVTHREAVRVRLRSKHRVACEFSGGLDTSSIVFVADSMGDTLPGSLLTLSTVYDQSTTCDESYFIDLADKARGTSSIYVHEEEQSFTLGLKNISFKGFPNNFDFTPGRFPTIAAHMQKAGSRILLTGIGGDHIFCTSPRPEALVADLLQSFLWLSGHQCCKVWSRFTGTPYLDLLFKALPLALAPFLPTAWQYNALKVPSWLNIRSKSQAQSCLSIPRADKHLHPTKRFQITSIDGLIRALSTGRWNSTPHLYVSHPLNYRPLLELCLAIPMTQFVRNGETRSLLRRALTGLIPRDIKQRKSKGNVYEALARATEREWEDIGDIRKWEVVTRGYVKAPEFGESLRKMRIGLEDMSSSGLRAVAVERFLRSLSLISVTPTHKFMKEDTLRLTATHSSPAMQ